MNKTQTISVENSPKSDASALSADKPAEASAGLAPKSPEHKQASSRGGRWLLRIAVQGVVLIAAFVAGIALIGLAQRVGWIAPAGGESGATDQNQLGDAVYTCPMHPEIRQDEPGRCPICGMELVPVEASASQSGSGAKAKSAEGDDRYICPMMCTPPQETPGRCPVCAMELVKATDGGAGGSDTSVSISPAARRIVGIKTAQAKSGTVERTIRTVGRLDYDQERVATIAAYIDGRIEELFAEYVGIKVAKGDELAVLYSPQLYSAQVEYLSSLRTPALNALGGGSVRLSEVARDNLKELGMTEAQIEELRSSGKAQKRLRITSPIGGTVIDKFKVEGDYVKTGEAIYRVVDLSAVWLMLDLYPDDAAAVRFGQQVEAEVQSLPGEVFTGRVAFVDPLVDRQTRTVAVRVEMTNYDGRLKPGDYATAHIRVPAVPREQVYDPALAGKWISPMHPQIIRDESGQCPICGMDLVPTSELGYAEEPLPEMNVVTVPRSAVLMAGDNSVVYVETQPGVFEIRRVTVGPLTDTEAVILEGVQAGETVATEGNFLIDSQMQLAGNPSLIDPSRAPTYTPGPLKLPDSQTVIASGELGEQLDRVLEAYFTIQQSLADDKAPAQNVVNKLSDGLRQLLSLPDTSDSAQAHLKEAEQASTRLAGTLEESREAFRLVSHALLRVANITRGPESAKSLVHFYCPMVPGGGGDWMQPGGELANPYFGSEMLRCGEKVRDMEVAVKPSTGEARQGAQHAH
jgi:membrane fusion protein, copper/silver efflux system